MFYPLEKNSVKPYGGWHPSPHHPPPPPPKDITVLGQFCVKHIVAEAEIYSHFINIQEIQV